MATIVGFDQAASDFTVTESRFPLVPVGSVWLLSDAVMPGAPHCQTALCLTENGSAGARGVVDGMLPRAWAYVVVQAYAPKRPCAHAGMSVWSTVKVSVDLIRGNLDEGPRSWSGDYKTHTESLLELSIDYLWATSVSRLTTGGT